MEEEEPPPPDKTEVAAPVEDKTDGSGLPGVRVMTVTWALTAAVSGRTRVAAPLGSVEP